MTRDPAEVTATEHGLVRLFSTELEPKADAAITAQNVHKLLGTGIVLDAKKVEVIPSRALEGLGLRNYLIQGYGIAEKDLQGKAAALDALKGLIILIPSSAFRGIAQTLDPNPALRFIGTFREAAATPSRQTKRHDSTEGHLDPPKAKPAERPTPRTRSWIGAAGAVLIALLLVLLLAF